MTTKYLIAVAAAAMTASAYGQAPLSPAEHLRQGQGMFVDENILGTIDQLTRYTEMTEPVLNADSEQASFTLAIATLRGGQPEKAEKMFKDFLAKWPASLQRNDARTYLADIVFADGDWARALKLYSQVDPNQLTPRRRAEYWYRSGYCNLKLAEYGQADECFLRVESADDYALYNAGRFYRGYIAFVNRDYIQAKNLFLTVNDHEAPGNMRDYYLSQIYFLDGDYAKASSAARNMMRSPLEPSFMAEMNRIAGESAYLSGNGSASSLQEAVKYLKRYADAVENPMPSSLYILGLSYYDQGQYTKAIEALQSPAKVDDAMGQSACLYLGQAYLKEDNSAAALAAFDRALRMDFDKDVQESAFYNYAVARSQGGQLPFSSSVAVFEEFLERFPNSRHAPEVQKYLVTGYITDGNYQAALASINRIASPSAEILGAKQRVLYNLGAQTLGAGQAAEAIPMLRQSLDLARYNSDLAAETRMLLADAYHSTGNYDGAVEQYRSYLASAPADAVNRPLARYNLGYCLFAQKDYKNAATEFAALTANPAGLSTLLQADAWNRLADSRLAQRDFKGAAEGYAKAYDTNPATGDYALFQQAMMYGYTGAGNEKLRVLDSMIPAFPESSLMPEAMLEKAQTLIALDRTNAAVDAYKALIERYPTTAQGRNGALQLANAYASDNRPAEAIDTYKKVLTDFPSSSEARIAAEMLKHLMAQEDRIDEYAAFISNIPGATLLQPGEADTLAYNAALTAWRQNGQADRLRSYLGSFPNGTGAPEALRILTLEADKANNDDMVLQYSQALMERFPDSPHTVAVLELKARTEQKVGMGERALETWRHLFTHAEDAAQAEQARWGIMRTARDLAQWNDVISQADALSTSATVSASGKNEAIFSRALAQSHTGKKAEAAEGWKSIASQRADLYGAKANVYLAEQLYNDGQLDEASDVLVEFINNDSPHNYWKARAFIILSDIIRDQGDTFTADSFLTQLRENYPGSEPDIHQAIDSRLNANK